MFLRPYAADVKRRMNKPCRARMSWRAGNDGLHHHLLEVSGSFAFTGTWTSVADDDAIVPGLAAESTSYDAGALVHDDSMTRMNRLTFASASIVGLPVAASRAARQPGHGAPDSRRRAACRHAFAA